MDCIRFRGQSWLHLESANKRSCARNQVSKIWVGPGTREGVHVEFNGQEMVNEAHVEIEFVGEDMDDGAPHIDEARSPCRGGYNYGGYVRAHSPCCRTTGSKALQNSWWQDEARSPCRGGYIMVGTTMGCRTSIDQRTNRKFVITKLRSNKDEDARC